MITPWTSTSGVDIKLSACACSWRTHVSPSCSPVFSKTTPAATPKFFVIASCTSQKVLPGVEVSCRSEWVPVWHEKKKRVFGASRMRASSFFSVFLKFEHFLIIFIENGQKDLKSRDSGLSESEIRIEKCQKLAELDAFECQFKRWSMSRSRTKITISCEKKMMQRRFACALLANTHALNVSKTIASDGNAGHVQKHRKIEKNRLCKKVHGMRFSLMSTLMPKCSWCERNSVAIIATNIYI